MIPRSKAEIMCMIRALYIDRISIVIWWKYWILLTPCPSFLALGSWMWRNELRSVCVTDCRLASLPAQQLSWCRHHSKLSAGAWIFAVLTPSNNNTNIFIVIMLDIFKVNAICWIHWHWALAYELWSIMSRIQLIVVKSFRLSLCEQPPKEFLIGP